jgi:CDP-diacylglycerol--glycerol-3-phosphate 3-phosphatidyltransferase
MSPKSTANDRAFRELRRQWFLAVVHGAIVLALAWNSWGQSPWWLALAMAVLATQLAVLFFYLPTHAAGKKLAPLFGLGTWLSLLRLVLLSLLAGFLTGRLSGPLAWVPFALALAFNLLDLADGYAARVSRTATKLGERLDLDLDGRGMLLVPLLAVIYGTAGWWYLLVGAARYVYVFGIWLRRRRGQRFTPQKNRLRRPLAGVQMGIGVALLAPGLPTAAGIFISSFTMLPFLANFAYDWLVESGQSSKVTKRWLSQRAENLALLFLRATVFLVALSAVLTSPDFALEAVCATLLLLGVAGRPLAFTLLIATGVRLLGGVPQPIDFALLGLGLCLLYLGVGDNSLRRVSEGWVFRRAGEKTSA